MNPTMAIIMPLMTVSRYNCFASNHVFNALPLTSGDIVEKPSTIAARVR